MRICWLRWVILGGLVLAVSLSGTPRTVLAQTPHIIDSPDAEMRAGFSRAIALGDVTGDGNADIVVGAEGIDSGRGRVYIFDGATRALIHTYALPATAVCPAAPGCHFGAAVAVADVTGNGRVDLIVGSPFEDVDGNSRQGRVYVFQDLTGSLIREDPERRIVPLARILTLTTPAPQAGANFGVSVAALDVDGDGRKDVVVGAPAHSADDPPRANAGQVFGFDGATGALLGSFISLFPEEGGSFGAALATGNLWATGRDELIVGAPDETVDGVTKQGRAYVFAAETPFFPIPPPRGPVPLAPTPLVINAPAGRTCRLGHPAVGCSFGYAVATADVDGDGHAEVIVGADTEDVDVPDQGRVYVFDGIGVLRYTLDTPDPNRDCAIDTITVECNRFGVSVAGGDVNGDGYADIIVGANAEPLSRGGNGGQGRLYVFSGRDGSLLWRLDAPNPSSTREVLFGSIVAAGDADGDGVADIAAGALWESVGRVLDQGRVYLIHGERGVRVTFETPSLTTAERQVVNPYEAAGVQFTAEAPRTPAAVVGVVKNRATSACVEPEDSNQKLGTGQTSIGLDAGIGNSAFPIRATFTTPLAPPARGLVTVRAEFQTVSGTTVRLRLFDSRGGELASVSETARPADGTCGNPGDPRARRVVEATATSAVAYAIMDAQPSSRVFVIDNFGWTP